MIKKEIKKEILKSDEDEAVFLLGDFNGHTGTIGEQQQNYNGKLLMDLIIECNLTMLNDTDKCTGINTWSRGNQKSTIDFVLVNNKGYQTCEWRKIDETQDVTGRSNYDSLFARTVAYPVQVAYWTKEVIAPCGYSVPCQF